MPDWRTITENHLAELRVNAGRREEIITEIACHIEDIYDDLRRQGSSEEDAARMALNALDNATRLCDKIQSIESVDLMNHRVKAMWLPALAALVTCVAMLVFAHPNPSYASIVGFQGTFNQWLLHQSTLFFDWRWLVILPLIGGCSAYWSRRQGGTIVQRALAATMPALAPGIFLFPFILLGVSRLAMLSILGRDPGWATAAAVGLYYLAIWVVAPILALLAGAIPFLRRQNLPSALLNMSVEDRLHSEQSC